MQENFNPFLISGYHSEKYFCNRVQETEKLIRYTKNGNNVTLFSPRRLGKTGLIRHTFEKLRKEKLCETLYVDIFATRNLDDFVKVLSEAVLRDFPDKTPIGKQFWEMLKKIRPLFGFDSLTGSTTLQFTFQTESEKKTTLLNILHFLERQERPIVVALDEFQQIRDYPEGNMEAILRTEIQHLHNVRFIFCGSKRRIMVDMFANAKRPFYQSTTSMFLEKIDKMDYADFIKSIFQNADIEIDNESVDFILEWTQIHTYYTQFLCNQIYSTGKKEINIDIVKNVCKQILDIHTPTFTMLRQMLTPAQWNYLVAVAKEGKVEKITAQNFLLKHKIGTPSNSKRLMSAMLEKELILDVLSINSTEYQIYDVFFYHWLKENY